MVRVPHAAPQTLNPNPRELPSIPQSQAEIVMVSGSSDAGNVSPSPASILLASEAQVAFSRNRTTAIAKRLWGDCTVEVSFWNADPPNVSYYTLGCKTRVEDADLDDVPAEDVDVDVPPRVVGAEGRFVLLRVLFSGDCEYEYFMYKGHSKSPSLENVPLPAEDYCLRGVEEFAIVPHGDDGHYLLIALCGNDEKVDDYWLHIYSSEDATWRTKELLNPCPENLIVPDKVFVLPDGFLLWVDLLRGILVCDIHQEQPHAQYIPLPKPLPGNTGKVNTVLPRVRNFRDVTYVDGLIKFIEMEHHVMVSEIPEEDSPPEKLIDHRTQDVLYDSDLMTQIQDVEKKTRLAYSVAGWSVVTWTREIGSNCWLKGSIVHVDDISVNDPFWRLTLKNLYLDWPTLSTDGNDILYLKSHSKFGGALLAVDLAKKKALKMEGPRKHPFGNYFYFSPWNILRPCALANHLKMTTGTETSASQIALMGSSANEPNNTAVHVGKTDSYQSENKRLRLSSEKVNHAQNGAQSTDIMFLSNRTVLLEIIRRHLIHSSTTVMEPGTKGIHSNTLPATHIPMVSSGSANYHQQ